MGPDPGKMGWGVKIGRSRGPMWRLDPLLGPILVILSHFGPFGAFFDPFWPFGWGAKAPGPPKVGVKWGGESKKVGPEGPKWRLDTLLGSFLVILSHLGPFLGLF